MRNMVFFALLILTNLSFAQSIYDYKVQTINGDTLDFATFKGKKIMIVNTASKCGLTPQFAFLQELYLNYKDSNFVIVGFPTNDFMNQDPGTDKEIESFCVQNYGVSFPMMSKITVKGNSMEPIYQFLTSKKLNGVEDSSVKWNFQKYLIDENGKYVRSISPSKLPNEPSVIQWISGK